VQLDDEEENNKTHVVFSKGMPKFVPATHKIEGESARLAEPYTFKIISLDTSIGQGLFKMK
jgi:hypothetical protein